MMKLHQIKVQYVPEQDRLLARVSTTSGEEILLWLTRRCVLLLWPELIKMAEASPQIAVQASPEARKALVGFQHEQALSQSDFSKPYEEQARARPFGADPLLVTRIVHRKDEAGKPVLGLLPKEGDGVFLTLDDRLLHGLMRLLQSAVSKAEWAFQLSLPTAPGVVVERVPRTLN
jgi:hypothetical protein